VSVSLDSSDPAIHDDFRCHPGAHRKALEAIRLLREREVTVNVDYTATRVNRQGLEELLPLVSPYGVKSLFLKRFRPLGRGRRNAERLALTLAEYRESVLQLIGSCSGSGTEVCFEDPAVYAYCLKAGVGGVRLDGLYGRFGCLAGVVWLGLQPNGDVTPCPLLNLPVGNIQSEDLATALARSPIMARLLDRNDRGGKCGTCDDRWRCGGCRAHADAATGDPFAEDPFCLRALAVE
jgi:radical SAM protein with 4Fe4S-binding SPASM domain